jgi:hypothetical protein
MKDTNWEGGAAADLPLLQNHLVYKDGEEEDEKGRD